MSSRARLFEYGNHWLIRRKDTPHFHIYWCKPGSRRVRRKSTDTGNLEAAKRRLVEFVHERQRPRDRSGSTVPILEVLNFHIEHRLAGRPHASRGRDALKVWDAFLDAHSITWVSELTLDVQEQFVAWRRRRGACHGGRVSDATILTEQGFLRAALREYWKRGYLKEVPFIRAVPKPPARQRFLTQAEFQRLLAACELPHLRLFVQLAVHTIQRPGAILSLRCDQVDLARNRIDFLPPDTIQSKKRKPVVPITATLRPILETATRYSHTGFIVEYKGAPVREIKHSFRQACKRAGLGKDVTAYTLRHTGATLLAAAGVPLRQIGGMMGHSEARTTELYAKHSPDFLKEAASALDAIFEFKDDLRAKRAPEASYPQVGDSTGNPG